MGFSFGFSDEDIDEKTDKEVSKKQEASGSLAGVNPLDEKVAGFLPEKLSLEAVLESLVDIPMAFAETVTPTGLRVYRRELFDVKHQLMFEEDRKIELNENLEGTLMGNDDLKKWVYEGGLKTWECSLDLIDYLAKDKSWVSRFSQFIELGSGTSLPGCFIFNKLLELDKQNIRLVLSDYNKAVLRLVTVPNLVINWFMRLDESKKESLKESFKIQADIESELQLSEELILAFCKDVVTNRGFLIELISGSWSREFLKLLNLGTTEALILSSETIYSPNVVPVLSETVLSLVKGNSHNFALVAAKDIYFGVGGTVHEFLKYLESKRKLDNIDFTVLKISTGGLNRSIVEIKQ